jgi:hypothetical protein
MSMASPYFSKENERMTMPLPSVIESRLPNNPGARESVRRFETLVSKIEKAFKSEVNFEHSKPPAFPPILASWLLGSLHRVRVTSWGLISSLNAPNELLFALSIRALMESAAYAAYAESKLQQLYEGQISREEMTRLTIQLKFATRKLDDKGLTLTKEQQNDARHPFWSVNAVTAMKFFDRFAELAIESGPADSHPFPMTMTSWYEQLCEYCHPNLLGTSIGSELPPTDLENWHERFEVEPTIRADVFGLFSEYAYVAAHSFCRLYNRCWDHLISHNEVLPHWNPPGEPRIRLE